MKKYQITLVFFTLFFLTWKLSKNQLSESSSLLNRTNKLSKLKNYTPLDNSHAEKDSNTSGESFKVKKGMEAFVQLKDLIESESLSAQLILRVLLSSNVSDEIKIAYLESFS